MTQDTIIAVVESTGTNWNAIGLYVGAAIVLIGIAWVLIRYFKKGNRI